MRFLLLIVLPLSGTASSEECRTCHTRIWESYRTTAMARSARALDAGAPTESFDRAEFSHAPSGFRYRVSIENGRYVLAFERPGGPGGSKPLAYAVGSGERAISYLINEDGFLYEAPAAYYSLGHQWGLSPGYGRYSFPYLARPIAPGCLSCHASFLQAVPGTLNKYRPQPFLEGGVACERCHGDGARHVAKMRAGEAIGDSLIVQPAKLAPAERDSICAQCHLTGDVRVMRLGMDWQSYHPGARLSDYQTVFVRARKSGAPTVTGHVESLAASGCKRAAGDRLWCGSCHDPHVVPARAEAVAWFRSRCLACHAVQACKETAAARAQAKDNCMGCHMPKVAASDAEHTVFTDHSIPRRPRKATPADKSESELVAFDGAPALRDVALAYAIAAVGKTSGAYRARARALLERVASESSNDVEALVSLAEIYRTGGEGARAEPLYRRAIAVDPAQATALVGLGGILTERGGFAEAARLWEDALSRNNGLELVRLNLAWVLVRLGKRAEGEAEYRKAWQRNPAFMPPAELVQALAAAGLRQ